MDMFKFRIIICIIYHSIYDIIVFFLRLNESVIEWIVNDDWYSHNQSYYKIFYCCLFILLHGQ